MLRPIAIALILVLSVGVMLPFANEAHGALGESLGISDAPGGDVIARACDKRDWPLRWPIEMQCSHSPKTLMWRSSRDSQVRSYRHCLQTLRRAQRWRRQS